MNVSVMRTLETASRAHHCASVFDESMAVGDGSVSIKAIKANNGFSKINAASPY